MTKRFDPGQIVLINTNLPGVPKDAQGTYVQLLTDDFGNALPYPHEVDFEGELLVLVDQEVVA